MPTYLRYISQNTRRYKERQAHQKVLYDQITCAINFVPSHTHLIRPFECELCKQKAIECEKTRRTTP